MNWNKKKLVTEMLQQFYTKPFSDAAYVKYISRNSN